MSDHPNSVLAERPTTGVVIVAAGASHRMVGIDKTWATIDHHPVIAHTIAAFEQSPLIDEIVLVVAADRVTQAWQLARHLGYTKVKAVVAGGTRRRDSVYSGLTALHEEIAIVLIHDGARPLVTDVIIAAGLLAVTMTGAATASVPVKDTIKGVDATGIVIDTPNRAQLYAIQTPQVFDRRLILAAHRAVDASLDVTDDARLAEIEGHRVCLFAGSYTNLKITTPDDIALVRSLHQGRK